MNLKYIAFHTVVHLAIVLMLTYAFGLGTYNFLLILIATAIIDSDHLPLLMKKGINGYLKTRSTSEMGKPRKYPMHNFVILFISLLASFLIFSPYLSVGMFFLAVALHLLWDLVEDVLIFRMSAKHWKI